ncbi:MAG: CocE/NonD family hydrolase [Candidatus Aminicenantes bacterium]|nr:CocE/NonD family hydrolase [Candidatus Aminicenantes bacterium]
MFFLLLFATFASVSLSAEPSGDPMAGTPYGEKLKVTYERVAMRDGVELAVRIIRPDVEGRFPAVMIYYPYRFLKQGALEYDDEPWPFQPMLYLAGQGYAIVQYDTRGTGNSGGSTRDMYNPDEQRDGYEMVEWIAARPWCNRKVGMMGISYGGVVQWQVAKQAPPSLKAIIVRSGNDDNYTEFIYPGGVLRPFVMWWYAPQMTAMNFAPPDPELTGEKWSAIWEEHLQNNRPWGYGYVKHMLDGPYWRGQSLAPGYDRVKCAVFVIGGWADWYPTALLRAFCKLKVPKRALVGPWGHWWPEVHNTVPGPRIDGRLEYLKWFDYWLKGIDNGVMDEPPVTLFKRQYKEPSARMYLEEPGFWQSEMDWPVPRTQYTPMYFHDGGRLGRERPSGTESGSDRYEYDPAVGITSGIHAGGSINPWGMPVDQRLDEAHSLVYTSEPLDENLEVTGNPAAVLHVSSTADVAYFRVKLIDVAPDKTAKLVRYGGLNATHRNSHSSPEPLETGAVHELRFDLKAMSYVFAKGHRIRVAVAGGDMPNAWPTPKPAVITLHRDSGRPSHLVLPVVPAQNPELPAPGLKRLANADPDDLAQPKEYSITRDLVNNTTTLRLHVVRGTFLVDSRFTVSSENPARATVNAKAVYTVDRPESKIRVESNELTTSDESSFRYVADVEVTVNGARHFNKSWSVTVPRQLN